MISFHRIALAVALFSTAALAPLAASEDAPTYLPLSALEECDVLTPAEAGGGCTGIRPGAPLTGPSGNGAFCTLAWAFTSGDRVFITTAGHCVGRGQRVGTAGVGAFGTVLYSHCGPTPLFETCEPGYDYAIIEVDAAKRHLVTNDLCGWGVATGVFEERTLVPGQVVHHGYGLVLGATDATRARTGVSSVLDDERKLGFFGAASPGDSGSAAGIVPDPTTGEILALGIITHIVAYTEADPDPVRDGTVTGTRLDVAVADLEAALGLELEFL